MLSSLADELCGSSTEGRRRGFGDFCARFLALVSCTLASFDDFFVVRVGLGLFRRFADEDNVVES